MFQADFPMPARVPSNREWFISIFSAKPIALTRFPVTRILVYEIDYHPNYTYKTPPCSLIEKYDQFQPSEASSSPVEKRH